MTVTGNTFAICWPKWFRAIARACIVCVDGQSLSPLVGTDGGQFESGGARAQRQLQSLVQPARHRSGHWLQGRFKSVAVSREEWGLELSRYVPLNPVRLGRLGLHKTDRQPIKAGALGQPEVGQVRQRVARLRAFRWSSYRA